MLSLKFIVLIVINLIGLGFSINLTLEGISKNEENKYLITTMGICCIVLNSLCIIINLMGLLTEMNNNF